MISVILSLLKIIGFIILALLGIILLILFCILFIPIRYRVNVEHGDYFNLDGTVSWFLHLIHAKVCHADSKWRIWVRILGILVYDSSKQSQSDRKKVKPVRKSNRPVIKDKTVEMKTAEDAGVTDKIPENEPVCEDRESKNCEDRDRESKNINTGYNLHGQGLDEEQLKLSDKELEEDFHSKDKLKWYNKVKSKIAGFYKSIKRKIIELKNKIIGFIQKLIRIKNKIGLVWDFLNNEINKEGFRFTLNSIYKIFKHIKPKKLKSTLVFGTGDPCTTGQVLGVIGILYSFYGEDLNITPDFENKVFKGRHYARGRIRLWTILIIVIKLLLDKRFKDLKMNYELLKEAL